MEQIDEKPSDITAIESHKSSDEAVHRTLFKYRLQAKMKFPNSKFQIKYQGLFLTFEQVSDNAAIIGFIVAKKL